MNIKHNKIKNTGILFELLVRRVAADVLDGKSDSFAVKIMREHFHPKTELGKELQLYRSFFNTPTLSETKAFNMLDLVLENRKTLNEKLLNAQKFLLIKEIKQHCDIKQFMAGRVPSYKVYASLYKLFEGVTKVDETSAIFNITEVVTSKSVVVEHLTGELKEKEVIKESEYAQILKKQPEEIRYLSYKILLEKFNDKYSVFNDNQKRLLREYINNGTDLEKFGKFISEESLVLMNTIQKNAHKINDSVTKIKINEVLAQLRNIKTKSAIKSNHITALLIAYQIANELDGLR